MPHPSLSQTPFLVVRRVPRSTRIASVVSMNSKELCRSFVFGVVVFVLWSGYCSSGFAQGPALDSPRPSVETSSPVRVSPLQMTNQHKFWDKKNQSLFAATAALNLADFSVTRANLQSGGRELNPVARIFGRSTAGLAANFAGETAGEIALSYFFHRIGHHKLERIISAMNISGSGAAVAYSLTHR